VRKRFPDSLLEAERLYVLDRGYAKFTLLQKILEAHSSFVCRVRNNSVLTVTEARALDAEAQHMGIVRDQVGRLGCKSKQDELPALIRLVQVDVDPRTQPHARGLEPYTLLIATDLLDVAATVIALLYRYRWHVELFFRFFKHSILKFFQVDNAGMLRRTSSARSFKAGVGSRRPN